jgi:hypothetical protein
VSRLLPLPNWLDGYPVSLFLLDPTVDAKLRQRIRNGHVNVWVFRVKIIEIAIFPSHIVLSFGTLRGVMIFSSNTPGPWPRFDATNQIQNLQGGLQFRDDPAAISPCSCSVVSRDDRSNLLPQKASPTMQAVGLVSIFRKKSTNDGLSPGTKFVWHNQKVLMIS